MSAESISPDLPNGKRARQRACMPKVRTGCLRCKARRIKCDETKPECKRCQKFGAKCDGYSRRPVRHVRPLLPRDESAEPISSSVRVMDPCLLLEPRPLGPSFSDDLEHRYFHMFQSETAAELTGMFASTLWSKLILQETSREPFVLDVLLAVSANSAGRKLRHLEDQGKPDNELYAQHMNFALKHYNKAIQTIRETLAGPQESPRRTLLATLMICCFEGISGQRFISLGHAHFGHKVMQEWCVATRERDPRPHRIGIDSPAPLIIEDELVQAFTRLDIQVAMWFDPRPSKQHESWMHEGTETVNLMPDSFPNLHEARLYFELISRRIAHFVGFVSPSSYTIHLVPNTDIEPVEEGLDNSVVKMCLKLAPGIARKNCPEDTQPYKPLKEDYVVELERWRTGFQPLYETILDSSSKRDLTAAKLLLVNFTCISFLLGSCFYSNDYAYDRHTREYLEIISLSKWIIESRQSDFLQAHSSFTFDIGVLPALHTISKWCRDRVVRREAIKLLKSISLREGVWDSAMLGELDERIMKMEESGVETDRIPAEARVSVSNILVHVVQRYVEIEVVRGGPRPKIPEPPISFEWNHRI